MPYPLTRTFLALAMGLQAGLLQAVPATLTNHSGGTWTLKAVVAGDSQPATPWDDLVLVPGATASLDLTTPGSCQFVLTCLQEPSRWFLQVGHTLPPDGSQGETKLEVLGQGEGRMAILRKSPSALTLLPHPCPAGVGHSATAGPPLTLDLTEKIPVLAAWYRTGLGEMLKSTFTTPTLQALAEPLTALQAHWSKMAMAYDLQAKLLARLHEGTPGPEGTPARAKLLAALETLEANLVKDFRLEATASLARLLSASLAIDLGIQRDLNQAQSGLAGHKSASWVQQQRNLAGETSRLSLLLNQEWDRTAKAIPWTWWRGRQGVLQPDFLVELVKGSTLHGGEAELSFLHRAAPAQGHASLEAEVRAGRLVFADAFLRHLLATQRVIQPFLKAALPGPRPTVPAALPGPGPAAQALAQHRERKAEARAERLKARERANHERNMKRKEERERKAATEARLRAEAEQVEAQRKAEEAKRSQEHAAIQRQRALAAKEAALARNEARRQAAALAQQRSRDKEARRAQNLERQRQRATLQPPRDPGMGETPLAPGPWAQPQTLEELRQNLEASMPPGLLDTMERTMADAAEEEARTLERLRDQWLAEDRARQAPYPYACCPPDTMTLAFYRQSPAYQAGLQELADQPEAFAAWQRALLDAATAPLRRRPVP